MTHRSYSSVCPIQLVYQMWSFLERNNGETIYFWRFSKSRLGTCLHENCMHQIQCESTSFLRAKKSIDTNISDLLFHVMQLGVCADLQDVKKQVKQLGVCAELALSEAKMEIFVSISCACMLHATCTMHHAPHINNNNSNKKLFGVRGCGTMNVIAFLSTES